MGYMIDLRVRWYVVHTKARIVTLRSLAIVECDFIDLYIPLKWHDTIRFQCVYMTRSTYHIPYCLILFLMSCQGCCYAQDIILGASAGVAIPTTNTDVQSPGFDWCVEANFRLKKTRVYLHGAFEQTSIYSTGTTKQIGRAHV